MGKKSLLIILSAFVLLILIQALFSGIMNPGDESAVITDFTSITGSGTESSRPNSSESSDPIESSSVNISKIPMSDLQVGDKIVDPSWTWERKFVNDYTNAGISPDDFEDVSEGGYVPVTWIIADISHYDELDPTPHFTLITEDIIALYKFDNGLNSSVSVSNQWGDRVPIISTEVIPEFYYCIPSAQTERGLNDCSQGISVRLFINDIFYSSFSQSLRNSLLLTPLVNYYQDHHTGSWDSYITYDYVFIPSLAELGYKDESINDIKDDSDRPFAYFQGDDATETSRRLQAVLPGYALMRNQPTDHINYWTRSPVYDQSLEVRFISVLGGYGLPDHPGFAATENDIGIRPVINLDCQNIYVTSGTDSNGVHTIIWN